MKKLILIIATLTIVSCNNKDLYEQTVERAKEMNKCKLEQTLLGYDSLTVCVICEEKVN